MFSPQSCVEREVCSCFHLVKQNNKNIKKISSNIHYNNIHIPKNTSSGVVISFFSLIFGFSAVWHITWLCLLSFFLTIFSLFIKSLNEENERIILAEKIKKIEDRHGKMFKK